MNENYWFRIKFVQTLLKQQICFHKMSKIIYIFNLYSKLNIYIYTKALADRILSSVQRSKNLRVKPGFPVRIFYLFKISSKKLISRRYIHEIVDILSL